MYACGMHAFVLERNNFLFSKQRQFIYNFTAYPSPRRTCCGETVVFSRSMQILVAFSSLNVPTIKIGSNKKITLLHVCTFSLDFVAIYTLAKTNMS